MEKQSEVHSLEQEAVSLFLMHIAEIENSIFHLERTNRELDDALKEVGVSFISS
jgi:hypothetical protein